MSQKIYFIDFKGICMNFLLELDFFISSHPLTSKQPHKIVQIFLGHPVHAWVKNNWLKSAILAIFQKRLGWLCPASSALKNTS